MTGIVLLVGVVVVVIAVGCILLFSKEESASPAHDIDTLVYRSSVDTNPVKAKAQGYESSARAARDAAFNAEILGKIEFINNQTKAKIAEYENLMALPFRQQQDMVEQARRLNELVVLRAASELGMTPPAYEKLLTMAFEHALSMSGQLIGQDQQVIKLFQEKAIEYQFEEWTRRLGAELGLYQTMIPHHQYMRLSEMLKNAQDQLAQFKQTRFGSKDARRRELKRLKDLIEAFQNALKERKINL
jgi:hypothetical protein